MTQSNSFLGTEETALIPPTSDEKTMAILSHVLCFVAWFVAPLVIYLIKKDESAFVRAHAVESLNFQITIAIAYFISFWLMFIFIGFILVFLLGITALVLIIIATIRASEGKLYKYPFSIKFVK